MYAGESSSRLEKFLLKHPVGVDDEKAPQFYKEIAKHFAFSPQKIAFIVVPHMVHTLPYFLQALTEIGVVVAIIPKASQYVPEVDASLKETYQDVVRRDISKTVLNSDSAKTREFIHEMVEKYPDHRLMILDHGGYFAPRLDVIREFSSRFSGIVEHTWNGHLRYQSESGPLPVQVYSIARSRLKAYEDDHVAASIISAMNANIFAGPGINQDLSRLQIGIIGYGHMGEAIAKRLLRAVPAEQIMVCDKSPEIRAKAERLFTVVSDESTALLLNRCDVIIAAASAPILGRAEFNAMKRNACVICVTSRDDQFKPDAFDELAKTGETQFVTTYKRPRGGDIHLACDGKSVNFSIGSTAHPILHAVLASVCVSAFRCATTSLTATTASSSSSSSPPLDSSIVELPAPLLSDIEMIYENEFGRIEHTVDSFGLQSSSCYFVGRKEELSQLGTILRENRVGVISQAIAGLGGMGKSTLASRYAKDSLRSGEYHRVVRFDATTAKSLYDDFVLFALHLGIKKPQQKRPRELVGAVYDRLALTTRILIIFDNPDKYSTLRNAWIQGEEVDFLPPVQAEQLVHCIATTRNQQFQSVGLITLKELKVEDACEYIQHYLPAINGSDAQELAETLSCFPLALCQMVAYLLAHPELSARDYLEQYKQQRSQVSLLQASVLPEDHYRETVYTTWNMSFQALAIKNPLSAQLISSLAYFDSSPIPAAVLLRFNFSEIELIRAIDYLRLYSLVEVNVKNQNLRFHDLVQTVSRLQQHKRGDFTGLCQAFAVAHDYGLFLGEPSSFVTHAITVTKYYDSQFPFASIPEKVALLLHIGSAQNYVLLFDREAVETYEFARSICGRSPADAALQFDIDLELAKAYSAGDPVQYVAILERMLGSDQLTIDRVIAKLQQYNIQVDLSSARLQILNSPIGQVIRLFMGHFLLLPPRQFFDALLSPLIKGLWLPYTAIVLASVGARDLAIAYLIFKNNLPQAEVMANHYLQDTAHQLTNERVQALCLYVEVLAFQGKLNLPDQILLLEEASAILHRPGIDLFYYDQVHFLLAVLHATNGHFQQGHQIVFNLFQTMLVRHGAEGIKRRITALVKMLMPLENKLSENAVAIGDGQKCQIKLLLAQAYRIAGRIFLTLKEPGQAKECLQKSLFYNPICSITHYEYGLLLARDRQTCSTSILFFKRVELSQISEPYSYFSPEDEFPLPKFMRPLVNEPNGYSLYFLACSLLAWVACRERRFDDCRTELHNLQEYKETPRFPVASMVMLERKLSVKEAKEDEYREGAGLFF